MPLPGHIQEKPHRLKLPSPDARVARSPFEGAKDLFTLGGQAADSDFTITAANANDGETVTIDGKVYTFQDTLTDVDGNVHIGTTRFFSVQNLFDAINRVIDTIDGTEFTAPFGEGYAKKTLAHPTVLAKDHVFASATFNVETRFTGTAGNTVNVTETMATGEWGNDPMTDGADPEDEVRFVPVVQWGAIRIRGRLTGGTAILDVKFARPNRAIDPATLGFGTGPQAFTYGVDIPAIDGTVLADGVEFSLDIPAAEHQGENWLRVKLDSMTKSDALDFLDVSGELLGTYH